MAYHDALLLKETGSLTKGDREMIIVATVTPDMMFPATACLVQDRLVPWRSLPARLARFDLNQYNDPAALQRLTGGPLAGAPEGLLTARVRGKGYLLVLLAYLAPIVVGAILIAFMFKPLFAP